MRFSLFYLFEVSIWCYNIKGKVYFIGIYYVLRCVFFDMKNCYDLSQLNTEVPYDNRWNREAAKPLLMHSIHVYPAKFPPLIADEAFKYADEENLHYEKVADIFCGCGTVALEAKRRGVSFWGCDINPVAVLIAKTKVNTYDNREIIKYYEAIVDRFNESDLLGIYDSCYEIAPERLKYWFSEVSYKNLYCLKKIIESTVNDPRYLNAFLCIFSSILKNASRWLQKSIKPQIDPNKKEADVMELFEAQVKRFLKATQETADIGDNNHDIHIEQENFLHIREKIKVDLLITSPPYVTSYEYADLHQLSSLWLGYTDDYKELRKGSIGSMYHTESVELGSLSLNDTAISIVSGLKESNVQPARIKAIARYYSDMEKTIEKCANMLNKDGMGIFVIGDSEINGVKLLNSKHIIESMMMQNFRDIKIGKRTIEKSMCVPYRNEKGRFTKKAASNNEIYHEEFIISGRIK